VSQTAVTPSAGAGSAEVADALTGYRLAFGLAVVFSLFAARAAWFIRDSDAAATMAARRRPAEESS
jgi:hypothetical protein